MGESMTVAYRVAHDREYQDPWRWPVPEVFHFDQAASTPLTDRWQYFIMDLNPGMTGMGYRSLLNCYRAFSNGTGYQCPMPRADFVNKLNTSAPLPKVDKVRVCGGAIIHGTLSSNVLTVETLDGYKRPPSIEWILDHPWLYFRCYTVLEDGSNRDFPQNSGKPVYFPLVARGKVTARVGVKLTAKPYPCLVRV
jgi:hypothetical protein